MITGIGMPFSLCAVFALKALTKSMMLTARRSETAAVMGSGLAPRAPRNDGSGLLDLRVLKLDRRGAAEDRDRHLEAGAALVDLLDSAVERGEGAVGDADRL